MMILRFFRRCHEFSRFVGRVVAEEEGRLYRIGVRTAWELAVLSYPSPREAERRREEIRRDLELMRLYPPYGIKPKEDAE